jgi:histone H3/H4
MARDKKIAQRYASGANIGSKTMPAPDIIDKKVRKPPKFSWAVTAKREIRRSQRGTHALLPNTVMKRIIKSLLRADGKDMRMTVGAREKLREISSSVLVDLMTSTERVRAMENGPKSIKGRHMQVARGLLGIRALEDSQLPVHFPLGCRYQAEPKTGPPIVPSSD